MNFPLRHNWILDEIRSLYHQPLFELIHQAAICHRQFHNSKKIQVCSLINIKSGGCPEDCKYCAQSSLYKTSVQPEALLSVEEVVRRSRQAIAKGITRVCLGAAWRQTKPGKQFNTVLEMIRQISALGVEVCCTLGMLDEQSAQQLKEAGIYAYNHNLDTSAAFYNQIITTRTYEDRLRTLDLVEDTKISVCCGSILGLGESIEDRLNLLQTLSNRTNHPESIPINILTPVPGTPMENQPEVEVWDYVRMVATTRILMPKTMVRLSSGRIKMSLSKQALCFMAGANSIFTGEVLLTVENPSFDADTAMLSLFGLEKMPAYQNTLLEEK